MTDVSKSLDIKLERIRSGAYRPSDFILADAKDGDMAIGTSAPGPYRDQRSASSGKMRPIADYRDGMRTVISSGLVDIMLSSVSSAEVLAAEDAYQRGPVTLAIRLNDATEIWGLRGGTYSSQQARPFRTARIDRAKNFTDLGLYAITFYNDVDRDVKTLEAYAEFRDEAGAAGMRHFLEIFNPSFPVSTADVDFGFYQNDAISRCLAGVARPDRPLFLKMPFNGARAMDELSSYDPGNLIVGILGGGAGTTRDTFELVRQAEKYGARIALFGRKIWFADSAVDILSGMRNVVEGKVTTDEAVRWYHDQLVKKNIAPTRSLEDDLVVGEEVLLEGLS